MEITQAYLHHLFDYDGKNLIWKNSNSTKMKAGKIAGSKNKYGHIKISIDGKMYLAHRLIWIFVNGYAPIKNIDHIDGNPANNKIENLRECNQQQNLMNTKNYSHNKSGIKGVSFHSKRNTWVANIIFKNKSIYLGSYKNIEDAMLARRDAESRLFGEWSRKT